MSPCPCNKESAPRPSTPKWVIWTIASIVTVLMLIGQYHSFAAGYARFYSAVVTFVFIFFALLINYEYFNELKSRKILSSSELNTYKARLKVHSEYFGFGALLGFLLTQYRPALELDKMVNSQIADSPISTIIQSIALTGLLLLATLAVGRKLALARFERYEAAEKAKEAKEASKESRAEAKAETAQATATATATATVTISGSTMAFASATLSSGGSASATASVGKAD